MAKRSAYLRYALAFAITLISFTNAQATVSPTATQGWTPAATCTNGLEKNATAQNGFFKDIRGATWQVNCGQFNNYPYYNQESGVGTGGTGILACFRSCDRRPGCTSFFYIDQSNPTTQGKKSSRNYLLESKILTEYRQYGQ
jgi:hypothetical protein